MKKPVFLFIALFCFILESINAQDKTIEAQQTFNTQQNELKTLLASKNFEFIANTALPLGQPPKNLVGSSYSVTFSPEMIISYMPYYGRSFNTIINGRDKGMRFKGAAEIFTLEEKDKGFQVITKVKNNDDTYSMLLMVSNSGFATLSISTNNRETIDYQGEVVSVRD